MDKRGWYWHERLRIRLAWLAFKALGAVNVAVWHASFGRVDIFRSHGRTNRLWDFWIVLASYAYLIDELKRGDMPEHQRVGGAWR